MEAVGKHDFDATAPDELSFKKHETIKILSCEDDQMWFKAECCGREGYVPSNYINMKDRNWYHGKLSRQLAEAELLTKNDRGDFLQPDGAFLVRQSESSPGDFSLSVKWGDSVQHFKVLRDTAGEFFLWVVKFESLNKLVDYHRSQSVSRTQTILLKDMVAKSSKPNDRHLYVKAMFDFEAQDQEEMSFHRGEEMKIIEQPDENWWKAESSGGKCGLIPSTYIEKLYKR